jgi:hypothetical protein
VHNGEVKQTYVTINPQENNFYNKRYTLNMPLNLWENEMMAKEYIVDLWELTQF